MLMPHNHYADATYHYIDTYHFVDATYHYVKATYHYVDAIYHYVDATYYYVDATYQYVATIQHDVLQCIMTMMQLLQCCNKATSDTDAANDVDITS